MLPYPLVRCNDRGGKAHSHEIDQIDRIHAGLHQFIKQIIIGRQQRHYLATICPSSLCLGIIMPVAALVTAITLVSPAIPYLYPTMKTPRQYPYYLLLVTHFFFQANIIRMSQSSNSRTKVFLFL